MEHQATCLLNEIDYYLTGRLHGTRELGALAAMMFATSRTAVTSGNSQSDNEGLSGNVT